MYSSSVEFKAKQNGFPSYHDTIVLLSKCFRQLFNESLRFSSMTNNCRRIFHTEQEELSNQFGDISMPFKVVRGYSSPVNTGKIYKHALLISKLVFFSIHLTLENRWEISTSTLFTKIHSISEVVCHAVICLSMQQSCAFMYVLTFLINGRERSGALHLVKKGQSVT